MKLIKWLLWVVLFVAVVGAGAAIFLVTTVDPNDFKPQISQKVEAMTGRKLSLGGDLSWRFYPWVGVTANDFSLSNRAGFAPENMLEASRADVQLKLLPLLKKQLEIGKIILQAPKINLAVNAEGASNWDDLAAGNPAAAPVSDIEPQQAAGAMLGGLVIQGVDISEGEISWDDQQAGQHYQLSDFNLSTGSIEPGSPVDFDLKSGVSGSDLPGDGRVALKGSLLLNEAMDALKLSGLDGQLSMDNIQVGLSLDSLDFSLAEGKLELSDVRAEGSKDAMSGQVSINTLNFVLESGMLDLDELQGEMKMDQIAAKLNAKTLSYALNSQALALKSLNYSGQYEDYPLEGEARDITFDVNKNTLRVASHTLKSSYNDLPVHVSGTQLQLDLAQESLMAPELAVALDDARFNVTLQASQIMGDVQAEGHLVSNTFNPAVLVEKLGLDVLAGMPDQAMQSLALETDFNGGLTAIALEKLSVKLDKSTLTGKLSISDFDTPAYRFDLQLDQINVDDYVLEDDQTTTGKTASPTKELVSGEGGTSETAPAAKPASGTESTAMDLPYAELKGLNVKGQITIGELRVQDLLSNDVVVNIDSESDRIEISPLRARVYGGEIKNSLVYDVSGDVPAVEVDTKLLSLNLGPFLQAMQITDRFDGFGSVQAQLSSSGGAADEAISKLNGNIDIKLKDGAIRGVNIQASLIKAEAMVKQLSGKDLGLSADLGDKTEFSEFGSDIKISNGVMDIRNLDIQAPAIRVSGGGKVDLNTGQLDLALDVSIVESFEGQGGASLASLRGETIPMKITGSLESPKILPDFSKILQKQLERELSKKYLGEEVSGESLDDALKKKLDEKLAKELGLEQLSIGAGNADAGADAADAPQATEPAPETEPLTDKQKLRQDLKKEGAKLLRGLFGG